MPARVFVLSIVLLLCSTAAAGAQPPGADADARRLFSEVMSPYCPGKVLADCTSAQAAELRAEIRQRLEGGESRTSIEHDLYDRFGDSIRAVPAAHGPGLILRVVPVVVLVLSVGAVAWYLVRRQSAGSAPAEAGAPGDPVWQRRLEDELDRS